jgi:hypothetical protein
MDFPVDVTIDNDDDIATLVHRFRAIAGPPEPAEMW